MINRAPRPASSPLLICMSIHAVYQPVGCCDSATLNHLRGTLRFGGSKRQEVFSYSGWPVLPSGLGRRVVPCAGDNIVRLAAISFATQPALASPVSWISRPWPFPVTGCWCCRLFKSSLASPEAWWWRLRRSIQLKRKSRELLLGNLCRSKLTRPLASSS